MKIHAIPSSEFSTDLEARWAEIQRSVPELVSPYFRPEFLRAVAAVRDDVWVGILEEEDRVVGFFPFQRARLGIGGPLGGHFADYQGVIAESGLEWDARELVEGCGLSMWNFDHLLASQSPFAPFHDVSTESPIMDLRQGYDAYVAELRARGSRQLQTLARKGRKLGREVGELRFEVHTSDREILREVIERKRNQCKATGLIDVFTYPWATELLERVLETQGDGFAGLLSVLYAGDELVAAHMGMRSEKVWHWWFPTYDDAYGKYSPGLVLLMKIAEVAPSMGIEVIDLGKGEEFYKNLFRNGAVPLAEGRVTVPSVSSTLVTFQERFEAWVRRSPLAVAARVPGRTIKRMVRRASLR